MRQQNPRGEMPFLDHLEELRWRIFKSGAALFGATVVGFLLVHYLHVTEILVAPIRPFLETQDGRLAAFSPLTPFFLELKLALIVGLILSFPILFYQLWAFLAPALETHERRVIVPSLYGGLVLFTLGVAMAYMLLPFTLNILMTQFAADYLNMVIGADQYLGFVVRLLLGFGVMFELPVVVMILTALGLVTPTFLRQKRRYAIVGITVVAAFISPGDVVLIMVAMMVPLILLYEFSILLSSVVYRRRDGEENRILADGPPDGAVEVSP